MFCLSRQERKIILILGVLILIGSILRFLNLSETRTDAALLSQSEEINLKMPIEVNRATQSELESIPGIGEVIARRIIGYRNQHGPFGDLEDLKKVKGIGGKKAENIKNYLKFNE